LRTQGHGLANAPEAVTTQVDFTPGDAMEVFEAHDEFVRIRPSGRRIRCDDHRAAPRSGGAG